MKYFLMGLCFLCGCSSNVQVQPGPDKAPKPNCVLVDHLSDGYSSKVYECRYEHVRCFVMAGYKRGGISCLESL